MPAETAIFARIKALVIGRTLHHYYEDKDALLRDRVQRRMAATGLDAATYLAVLERDDAAEWVALESEITIGETFFFRFAEQFDALSATILPALIAARAGTRRLRIWSAGCSTGAEPYSVAILLHRLLGPALRDWSISIVGSDISEAALQAARVGEFGDWALRSLSPEAVDRDFLPVEGSRARSWRLRPAFRAMVRFERRNLLTLLEPGAADGLEYDLVLCRNVLIYFRTDRVRALVRRFGESLAADGWLLLGHAEAVAVDTVGLRPVALNGIVAWRRDDAGLRSERAIGGPVPAARPPASAPRKRAASKPPGPSLPVGPDDSGAIDQVRRLADSGRPAEALAACRSAIVAHPLSAELFFYAALLQRALGLEGAAEADFRRAIYLCKQFAMAHYHLGLLLNDAGRAEPGRRSIAEAARIAGALPAGEILSCGDGMTAARLLDLSRRDWHPARESA